MSINSFHLDHLRRGIKPFKLHWFPRLRSTNDHAAELRRRGELYAPAIVLAGRQIAGRGRGSNSWWSAGGSITVTFVFPVEEHLSPHQVPLLAGLAVRDAAAELLGDEKVSLKWPND
ncbi:MAG: BirA family transcriptional regulator, partial [Humisphaera sp.]|nr:BirA family transcriptional regulator [Humisphaera sp.]